MGTFENKEPNTVTIEGKSLECAVCRHPKFWERKAQLHTALVTFFQLEWTSPSARCYICEKCGYIYWFLPPQKKNGD